MSEPNGYLIHGTAFSSKEAAFKALVSNPEQESWFHKIWNENAQPYYFEPQPQLTIPKSVADSIQIGKSKLTPALAIRWKGSLYNLTTGNIKLSKESLNWVLNGKNKEEVEERNLVLFAYLNPLTRNLVKVVEG